MKKFLIFVGCAFAAAPLLAAASTCETRVDKMYDKSTGERVQVCLTEEPEIAEEENGTRVILSDTHEVQYPKRKAKKQAPVQKEIKVYTQTPISREYLDIEEYPSFHNDVLPRMSQEKAHETALQAIHDQKEAAQRKAEEEKRKAEAKKKKKAAKKAKKKADVVPPQSKTLPADYTETYTEPAPAYTETYTEPAAAYTETYTEPTAAYSEQVNQAQALQNDPLYQDNTANGTTPDGFLEGGVMGQADFGYNATDPAYQP
ncbi:MAG: hypothetical protein IKJ44_06260 [Elusimicrobiaceae bacterium]|nr:hypothetical protein [Elusimicrobiaceae bacterium]